MTLHNLQDLFVHELRDIYDAEKRMTRALPKMAKHASSDRLRAAFEKHLKVTEKQIERLERVFDMAKTAARGKKCEGMVGLLEEGAELMEQKGAPAPLDAALIGAAQTVEHYEIAVYGTLVAYAQKMGMTQAARLLQQTLDEEKQTDEDLTKLASSINRAAEFPSEDHNGQEARQSARRDQAPARKGQANADPITGSPGAHPGGVAVGTVAGGAAFGAAGGAIGGPVGAAIGAVVGGVAGGYAGKAAAEYVDPTVEKPSQNGRRRRAKASGTRAKANTAKANTAKANTAKRGRRRRRTAK